MTNHIMFKRRNYYETTSILFEILKVMRDREVIFMDRKENYKCIRGLRFISLLYLQKAFQTFNFLERDYNIYISLSHYRFIPMFSYDLTKRSKETSNFFKNDAKNYIYHYDILFDFDQNIRVKKYNKFEWVNNRSRMIDEILLLSVDLKKQGFTFYIIPSGCNFQLIALNKDSWNFEEVKKFILKTKKDLKLVHVDKAGVGLPYKIFKCPYSLVYDICCLPLKTLSKEVLNNYEYFTIDNVMRNVDFSFRGIPMF